MSKRGNYFIAVYDKDDNNVMEFESIEQYDEYLEKNNKLIKEKQHYKHIIDELEKNIVKEFEYNIETYEGAKFLKGGFTINQNSLKIRILNKLQELKGNDNKCVN